MNYEDYENVFGIFKSINDELLTKENNSHESLSFLDYFMFQATSYMIALINDNILMKENSMEKIFLYRSLIECVTIMKMFEDDEISLDSIELLKIYDFLAEYKMYKKYAEVLDGKQFDFNLIKENYEKTRERYQEKYPDLNNKEFSKKINSRLPFLENEYNFDFIIKKYCEGLHEFYVLLSICIHPNDLLISSPIVKKIDFKELESLLIDFIMFFALKSYNYGKIKETQSLQYELFMVTSPLNSTYLSYAKEQYNALVRFSELIEKEYGENTQSYFCKELAQGVLSMAYDKTFGYSEIVKIKFKPLVEIMALNYYVAATEKTEENYFLVQLITKYTTIQLMKFYKLDYSQFLDEAYQLYFNHIGTISKESFEQSFLKSLGFLPKKVTITQFVYDFIDYITIDDQIMNAHMKMVYDESQYLSHANGYLLASNTGAFCEYSSVIIFIDRSIDSLLNWYIIEHKLYIESTGERRLNKLCYDLKKQLKCFFKVAQAKNQFDYDHREEKIFVKKFLNNGPFARNLTMLSNYL